MLSHARSVLYKNSTDPSDSCMLRKYSCTMERRDKIQPRTLQIGTGCAFKAQNVGSLARTLETFPENLWRTLHAGFTD